METEIEQITMSQQSPVTDKRERVEYIDAVKGVAILLVILGHVKMPYLPAFAYSFHMPLFFVLSGLFFNPEKPLKKRIVKLIKPYIFTCIAIILFEIGIQCIESLVHNHGIDYAPIHSRIIEPLLGSGIELSYFGMDFPAVGAIWFLLGLTWATIICWFLGRKKIPLNLQLVITGCAVIISILLSQRIWLPLSIYQGITGAFCMVMGMKLRRIRIFDSKKHIIIFAMVWLVLFVILYKKQCLAIDCVNDALFPLYIVEALCACIVVISVIKHLYPKFPKVGQWLSIAGKSTLVILVFHAIELKWMDKYVNMGLAGNETWYWDFAIVLLLICLKLLWALMWIHIHRRSKFLQRWI